MVVVKCGAGIKEDSICSYPSDILWYSFFTVKKIILPWKNVKEERQFTQMSNFDSFNARRPTRQPDPLFGAPRSARKFLFISWSSNLQWSTKIMTLNLECFGSSYLKYLDTKVFLGLNASKLQAQHEHPCRCVTEDYDQQAGSMDWIVNISDHPPFLLYMRTHVTDGHSMYL